MSYKANELRADTKGMYDIIRQFLSKGFVIIFISKLED